jgi:tRNA G18 (ribose-2'-O)-methylase SpoU
MSGFTVGSGPSNRAPIHHRAHREDDAEKSTTKRSLLTRRARLSPMALSPPVGASPDEVRRLLEPLRSDVSVALHAAENPFAVGAVIRVAHSFLAREILLVGEAPYYAKASMGMEKYEQVVRLSDDAALLERIAGRPLWAIEKDHATMSLYAAPPFPPGVVLLFGSERAGIPEPLVRRADVVIGIPIYGVNHSLPLAVAAGIVMSEHARQRFAPGATL